MVPGLQLHGRITVLPCVLIPHLRRLLFNSHDGEEDVDPVLDRIKESIVGYAKRLATESDVAAYHDVVLALFDRDRDAEALRHPMHGQVALHGIGSASTSDGLGGESDGGILLDKQKILGA